MRYKILLAAMVAAAVSSAAEARQLTPDEAWERVVAQKTTSKVRAGLLKPFSVVQRPTLALTCESAGRAAVYVFADAGAPGFYCVAATDAAPKALLGFSETSTFRADAMPPAMRWWLDSYAEELDAAGSSATAVAETDSVDNRADITPLLTTTWGQLAPFNDLVPVIGSSHAPVGCVALTMAQCMNHERWPAKGHGAMSYDWYDDGKLVNLALDFDTIAFDWDNIIDTYGINGGGTEAQRAAVAQLCYALGVSVKMQYNTSGSSSSLTEAAEALVRYFDYAETVCYHERDYYELEEWKDKIYAELEAGRTVPYQGEGDEGGHAFVCDGYQSGGYFHFNWGWYGSHDGYFLLSALNPGSMEGQYEKGYNRHQGIITGLMPSYESSKQVDDLYISGNFKTDFDKYLRTEDGCVTISGEYGIYSESYADATVVLGLELTAKDGTVSYLKSDSSVVIGGFIPVRSYTISMSEFPLSGSYVVRPAFCQADGTWRPIRAKLSEVYEKSMRVTPTSIIFSESPDDPVLEFRELNLTSPLFVGREFCLEATIGNTGGEFYDDVYVGLLEPDADTFVGIGPVVELDIPRDDVVSCRWIGELSATGGHTLTPGKYRMALVNVVDYRYALLSPAVDVELRTPSEAPLAYTIDPLKVDGATTTDVLPAAVGASTSVAMTFNCTQGDFGERVSLKVSLPYHSAILMETDVQFVAAEEGQSDTVSYDVDFSSLDPGTIYWVRPFGKDSGFLNAEPAYVRLSESGIATVERPATRIWRNPSDSEVHVESEAPITGIEVYTTGGMRCAVVTAIDGSSALLDVASLARGFYLVRVATDAAVHTHRLLWR